MAIQYNKARKIYANDPNNPGRRIPVGQKRWGYGKVEYVSFGPVPKKPKSSGPNFIQNFFRSLFGPKIEKAAEEKHKAAVERMGGTYNEANKTGTFPLGDATVTTGPIKKFENNNISTEPFVMKDLGMPDFSKYDEIYNKKKSSYRNQMGEQEQMIRGFYDPYKPSTKPPTLLDAVAALMSKR